MSFSRPMKSLFVRQYSRDSFDRFGDDLCELLLSYLCFEDKTRLQCVSKQWRRLVFNKVIHFDDQSLCAYLPKDEELGSRKYKHMKTILKKCHNLRTIKLNVTKQTVSCLLLLSDNCPRLLKSIHLLLSEEVSPKVMTAFGQTLGSKVVALDIGLLIHNIEFLKWFPNLKRLKGLKSDDWLRLVGNQLVPELIHLDRVSVEENQMSAFIRFVDKYKNTMKNIVLYFSGDICISRVFQQLYRLNNLEYLHFTHHMYNHLIDLTPRMSELIQYCPKLSKISLNINNNVSLRPPLEAITSIKFLSLNFRQIPDNFFANLSLLTPNLKEFRFTPCKHIYTNQDLIDLSRMKHLKRLVLSSSKGVHKTDDSAVIQLLDNCKELNKLILWFRSNITEKTISALKELANNRHKQTIRFLSETSGNKSLVVRRLLTEMPNNLSIILK